MSRETLQELLDLLTKKMEINTTQDFLELAFIMSKKFAMMAEKKTGDPDVIPMIFSVGFIAAVKVTKAYDTPQAWTKAFPDYLVRELKDSGIMKTK